MLDVRFRQLSREVLKLGIRVTKTRIYLPGQLD